jgi:hypothetical protein
MLTKLLTPLVPKRPQPLRPDSPRVPVRSTAEVAECTCPEFCERDHEND